MEDTKSVKRLGIYCRVSSKKQMDNTSLNNQKEKAHKYALLGAKDNPQIYFGESLKSQFFFQERQLDSAYYYSKLAFENLPNNMPHYNLYMNSLVARKDVVEMNKTFETVRALGGDTPLIWTIYLRSLANVTGLGDTMTMSKAAEAFKLFPQVNITDESMIMELAGFTTKIIEGDANNLKITQALDWELVKLIGGKT